MRMMQPTIALLAIALTLPGCSGSAPSGPASGQVQAAATDLSNQSAANSVEQHSDVRPTACALVTAAEMSKIFDHALQAEAHEGSADKTECIYKPSDGVSPYIELTVEWGEGEDAMRAVGAMGRIEPGIANPYEGIGDQAAAVGTALMIRTGDDLVTITFSGVEDATAKARLIFNTLKPKL